MTVIRLLVVSCWLLAAGALISGCGQSSIGLEIAAKRAEAASLYDAGQFLDAGRQWEVVSFAEPRAVDARINAAQAYLQADDLGRAMLYFRRAQALDPRHSAVQLGVALVRALRVDIFGDEPGVLPAIERLSIDVVSAGELAWLTVLAWSGAIGLAAAMLWQPRLRWLTGIAALVALLLFMLLIGRELSQRLSPAVVVTAFEASLMSEPGDEGVALSRVYSAAEARIIETREEWVLITIPDGRAGWLPRSDITPIREG